jgi:hypothetical protein
MEAKMKIRTTGRVRDPPYLKQVSLQIRLWPTHPHETHVLINTLLSVAHNLMSNSEVNQLIIFGGNLIKNKNQCDCIEIMPSSNNFKTRMDSASHCCSMVQHSSSFNNQTFIEFQLKICRCKVFVCSWKLALSPFEQICSFWIVLNIWDLLEQNEGERWFF